MEAVQAGEDEVRLHEYGFIALLALFVSVDLEVLLVDALQFVLHDLSIITVFLHLRLKN